MPLPASFVFFFNDTATTEIYTLSLHDALPILRWRWLRTIVHFGMDHASDSTDRKSTRLNSSHQIISYAVFCLKKKKRTGCLQRSYTRFSRLRKHYIDG